MWQDFWNNASPPSNRWQDSGSKYSDTRAYSDSTKGGTVKAPSPPIPSTPTPSTPTTYVTVYDTKTGQSQQVSQKIADTMIAQGSVRYSPTTTSPTYSGSGSSTPAVITPPPPPKIEEVVNVNPEYKTDPETARAIANMLNSPTAQFTEQSAQEAIKIVTDAGIDIKQEDLKAGVVSSAPEAVALRQAESRFVDRTGLTFGDIKDTGFNTGIAGLPESDIPIVAPIFGKTPEEMKQTKEEIKPILDPYYGKTLFGTDIEKNISDIFTKYITEPNVAAKAEFEAKFGKVQDLTGGFSSGLSDFFTERPFYTAEVSALTVATVAGLSLGAVGLVAAVPRVATPLIAESVPLIGGSSAIQLGGLALGGLYVGTKGLQTYEISQIPYETEYERRYAYGQLTGETSAEMFGMVAGGLAGGVVGGKLFTPKTPTIGKPKFTGGTDPISGKSISTPEFVNVETGKTVSPDVSAKYTKLWELSTKGVGGEQTTAYNILGTQLRTGGVRIKPGTGVVEDIGMTQVAQANIFDKSISSQKNAFNNFIMDERATTLPTKQTPSTGQSIVDVDTNLALKRGDTLGHTISGSLTSFGSGGYRPTGVIKPPTIFSGNLITPKVPDLTPKTRLVDWTPPKKLKVIDRVDTNLPSLRDLNVKQETGIVSLKDTSLRIKPETGLTTKLDTYLSNKQKTSDIVKFERNIPSVKINTGAITRGGIKTVLVPGIKDITIPGLKDIVTTKPGEVVVPEPTKPTEPTRPTRPTRNIPRIPDFKIIPPVIPLTKKEIDDGGGSIFGFGRKRGYKVGHVVNPIGDVNPFEFNTKKSNSFVLSKNNKLIKSFALPKVKKSNKFKL